jgi:hypothetical protein
MRRIRSKLTYVIPTLCLFMLVGGGTATAKTRIVWSRYSQTFSRLRFEFRPDWGAAPAG